MTFRQMELFSAVCECKSINKASHMYHVSQQGISKMIRELEEELGCTLLIRNKQGVTPTPYGAYFLIECNTFLNKKEYIYQNISKVTDFPKETLYLGMAYGVISALPNRLLSEFEKEHSHLSVEYSDSPDYYLEHLLLKDEYDFCISTGVIDSDRLYSELLFQEAIYLCIPDSHELFDKPEIQMDDLHTVAFAMFSTQFHIRHHFVSVCKSNGFSPNIEISSSDFNSLKEIAIHNNLIFIMPGHTIPHNEKSVRYYPFPSNLLHWDVYYVRKKSKDVSESMKLFYTYLLDSLPRSIL